MTVFLAVSAAAAAWVVSLYMHPFGRCWRCGGRGNIRRRGHRRAPKCRACSGKGRVQRRGSRRVHRIRRQVTRHWKETPQ